MDSTSLYHALLLFDLDEYRMLCLAVGASYENIVTRGGTLDEAAGRLIAWCERHGMIPTLVQSVVSERREHPLIQKLLRTQPAADAVVSQPSSRGSAVVPARDAGEDEAAPATYHSCFISYASADSVFVSQLYSDLQRAGVRCFYAPEGMKIGQPIRSTLEDALNSYDKLLLVLSSASLQSAWVEKEVETALDRERVTRTPIVFPIAIDTSVDGVVTTAWAKDIVRMRHIGDFRQWRDPERYANAVRRLLHDLRV